MKNMKKNKEEVKIAIINALQDKPLFVQQISEKIGSNWLTVKEALDELLKEQKIGCILSTDKIKIYRLADYPVFYGVPIQKKHKEASLSLFSDIVKAWKDKYNEFPPVTTIQKIAVDVINECKLDIPILPFHYGLVMPIFAKPEEAIQITYSETGNIKEKQLIINCIKNILPTHTKKAWQEEFEQYKKYDLRFFLAKHNLMFAFKNKNKLKTENFILDLSYQFPNTINNSISFSLFHRYLYASLTILNSKRDVSSLDLLKEVFESLWDLITTNMFFDKIHSFILPEDRQLFEIIKLSTLNSKIFNSEERLANLESVSESISVDEIKMPMDKESIMIRKILTEGAEEE